MERKITITVVLTEEEIKQALIEFVKKNEAASNETVFNPVLYGPAGRISISHAELQIELEELPF